MKKINLFLTFILSCWLGLQAQMPMIQLSGVVTQVGAPVDNHPVSVFTVTPGFDTILIGTTFTNPNGFYTKDISYDFPAILVTTPDCHPDSQVLTQALFFSLQDTAITADFALCEIRDCEAAFAYQRIAPLTIGFDNLSLPDAPNSSFYTWSFGDGGASTEREPLYAYSEAGTYTVCLRMITPTGCVSEFCDTVLVDSSEVSCTSFYTFERDTASPLAIQFQAASPNTDLAYLWDFGDGNESDNPSPRHEYSQAGVYTVCLKVMDANGLCADIRCETIIVGNPNDLCQAEFEYFPSPNTPLGFQFVSTGDSSGVEVSHEWSFGDGTTSNEANPFHEFPGPGTYIVYHLVSNQLLECEADYEDTIVIHDIVDCYTSFEYEIMDDGSVLFVSDPNQTYSYYLWKFGDGTELEGGPIEDHSYDHPGTYEVCLVVEDDSLNCRAEYCDTIVVRDIGPCIAAFEYEMDSTLAVPTVYFMNQSFSVYTTPNDVLQYFWDFGDGTRSEERDPVHIYGQTGAYEVCLTIKNADDSTCYDRVCQTVWVGPMDCRAGFVYHSLANDLLSFQFISDSLVDDSVGTTLEYFWNFGDGTESNEPNPRHEYEVPGIYLVCLKVINPETGCFDTYCEEVFAGILSECRAAFEYSRINSDSNLYVFEAVIGPIDLALIYTWVFPNGDIRQGEVTEYAFPEPGEYEVCLKVSTPDGSCVDRKCKVIVVGRDQCRADFEYDHSVSDPNLLVFEAIIEPNTQPLIYTWIFPDGTTQQGVRVRHLFPEAGEYEVCLKVSTPDGSCVDRKCKTIEIREDRCSASFSYTEPASLEITFSADHIDPGLRYLWFFGGGNLEQGPVVTYEFPRPGHYLVCLTVTDGAACQVTQCDTIYVSGGGGGDCIANFSYLIEPGGIYYFQDQSSGSVQGGDLSYEWDFGDGTTSTERNPTHAFLGGGNFEVCLTITDRTGCQASICQNIGGYTIEGQVFASGAPVYNGIAYLIYHDPINQTLTAIDTAYIQRSYYAFHNVGPGTYLVKAALLPDAPHYRSFLPTYLGDKLFWHQAISIVIATSSVYLPPINLLAGANPGGPGFIGGMISEGANKRQETLPDISVLLLDINENKITHTVTDANGEYSFGDLAWGTYKIFVEIPGKISNPRIVTIGPDTPAVDDADFVVEGVMITTNLEEENFGKITRVYPNPATNEINVDLFMRMSSRVYLNLMNMVGQDVIRQELQLTQGNHDLNIDLSRVPSGVYLLNIRANGQLIAFRVLKR